ncbi:hypothetical protein DLM46_35875 [Paraburkholderia lacunae]|uniref:Uncharacterized protein n=1 Tax=Paraburkholderia lacunae TaxID=2211104 RepID=A0A370MWS7_9BURK|nr:hypothetical protein DLM46_35875 [Paraburkholderia lacunae]
MCRLRADTLARRHAFYGYGPGRQALSVRRSPFAVRRSPFAVRRSPFAVRRSPFARPFYAGVIAHTSGFSSSFSRPPGRGRI